MLVALVVRVALLPVGEQIVPSGDSNGYVYLAQKFRESGTFSMLGQGVRPPIFRMLLAPGFDTSTSPPSAFPGTYLIQIGMDVLAMALLMQLARRRFGPRAALASGWLYALLPQSILYSSTVIMAETIAVLAVAVALLAFDGLDRALERSPHETRTRIMPRVLLLGVTLGLGILTKELLVPVTAAIAIALLFRPTPRLPRRLLLALATVAVALLVTTPWLAWTHEQYGVPVLSGTFGDLALGFDNPPPGESPRQFFKEYFVRDVAGKVEYAREIFRRALFEYPALTAERALVRLRIVAGPEDHLAIWFAMTFDGFLPVASSNFALARQAWVLPEGWGRRVQWICGLCAVIFFALGAAGIAAVPRNTMGIVTLLALLAILATVALTVSCTRYRHSMVPFMLPFAGHAVVLLIDRLHHRPSSGAHGRRALTWGLTVGALLTLTIFALPAP